MARMTQRRAMNQPRSFGRGLAILIVVVIAAAGFTLGFFVGRVSKNPDDCDSFNVGPSSQSAPSETIKIGQIPTVQKPEPQPLSDAQSADAQPAVGAQQGTQAPANQDASNNADAQAFLKRESEAAKKFAETNKAAPAKADQSGQKQTKPVQTSTAKKDAKQQPISIATAAATGGKFHVQVGAFSSKKEADALYSKLSGKGYKASVTVVGAGKDKAVYKVKVGSYKTKDEARQWAVKIKNLEGLSAFATSD